MLDTLLESKSHRPRSKSTALVSAAFHSAIILGGAYATASGASAHTAVEAPAKVHWVTSPRVSDPVTGQTRRAPASTSTNRVPNSAVLRVRLDIPVDLPPINLKRPTVDPADFATSPSHAAGDSPATSGNRVGGEGGPQAYDASQVDTPVSMIGTYRPDYPPPLRSAGVEGQVVVQFVVNESGRVDRESIKIVSASNDIFAASVTGSLARMRFTPARIGNRAVAQLVQQLFVFRLDR